MPAFTFNQLFLTGIMSLPPLLSHNQIESTSDFLHNRHTLTFGGYTTDTFFPLLNNRTERKLIQLCPKTRICYTSWLINNHEVNLLFGSCENSRTRNYIGTQVTCELLGFRVGNSLVIIAFEKLPIYLEIVEKFVLNRHKHTEFIPILKAFSATYINFDDCKSPLGWQPSKILRNQYQLVQPIV